MKRELKFRCWHKGFPKLNMLTATPPEMLYDNKVGDCLRWLADGQPVDIMQFTGLKDKNGTEIYEGDILQFLTSRQHGFQEDGKLVILPPVQYSKVFVRGDTLYEFECFNVGGNSIAYNLKYGCEVVGNIYQNAELLNTLNP